MRTVSAMQTARHDRAHSYRQHRTRPCKQTQGRGTHSIKRGQRTQKPKGWATRRVRCCRKGGPPAHPGRVAPSELNDKDRRALSSGNADAINAHNASLAAARQALGGANNTSGDTQYRLRTRSVSPDRPINGKDTNYVYGPFINTIGPRETIVFAREERNAHMKVPTLLLALLISSIPARAQVQKPKISESAVKAVVQAVEDEIYDYGYQKSFYQIGQDVGTSNSPRSRIPIYIEPDLDAEDGGGRVIYKLMPYGEVMRDFIIRKNGLVVLSGNPQNGFPPTQETSTKTVYMDDDEVCQMKHDWLKDSFFVDDSPSSERIQEAAQRQKIRTGFSDWEYRLTHNKNP